MNGEKLAPHDNVHFAPIEDPSGLALHAFHSDLHELAVGKRNKVRIAFYGASSVAADRYPGYLRGYLQARFGDGGIGFVALVPLWRWHRHNSIRVDANKYWRIEHAQRESGKLDGYLGLLGATAHTSLDRAKSTIRARSRAVSKLEDSDSFELHFLQQPQGGAFSLHLGPKRKATTVTFQTGAERSAIGFRDVKLPEAFLPIEIDVHGDGVVRLMGGVFERDQPGVVVDALGIGGTRSASMVKWDEPMWSEALRRRSPSMYMLAYGANESVDDDDPIELYKNDLETVLDRFATAAPDASCVLIGPVDYPRKDDEAQAWIPRPRVREIIAIQRETAAKRGCGFFDTTRLTGGLGTMDAWATAEPPLAKGDRLHLTPLGYLHFGRVLSDALMVEFDRTSTVATR